MPLSPKLRQAFNRVRKVANGGTINGTYRQPVGESLASFRRELNALLDYIGNLENDL
jgi:hypothetical protein